MVVRMVEQLPPEERDRALGSSGGAPRDERVVFAERFEPLPA